jgi:DNA-binding GntR family transcriptional regulator
VALSRDTRLLARNATEHGQIRAAAEGGDAALARRLMHEHVLAAGDLIANVLERDALALDGESDGRGGE